MRFRISFAVLAIASISPLLASSTLSSNLSNSTDGIESVSGSNYVAGGFSSGASNSVLESVTLLLGNSSGGQAEVDLYADATLQPSTLIEQLTSSAIYSATPSATTFSSSDSTLAANTTYWIVLKALSGVFDWAWTSDNSGAGTGFQGTWAVSEDGGSTWFSYDLYPVQLDVETAGTATPELHSAALLCAGGLLLAVCLRTRNGVKA